jgi:hypothetical protein
MARSEFTDLQKQVGEVTRKNPSLENWIRTLDSRIDIMFGQAKI